MQINVGLTAPQLTFVQSQNKAPAIVGGLGCMRGDTRIHTEHGLMRICDITSATRVLSYNQKENKFQLSLSGGSFPKGRANLYRVVTQSGEFVASGHHQILSSCGNYRPVADLEIGDKVLTSACPPLTSQDIDQLSSLSDAHHYLKTNEDLMGYCADVARQCGQQLLTDQEIDLFYPPLQGDAQKLSHTSDSYAFSHLDALEERLRARSRRDQFGDLKHTMDCESRNEVLEVVEAGHISSLPTEHTLVYRLKYQLSLLKCAYRRTVQQLLSVFYSSSQPCDSYSSTTETVTIISVEELDNQEPYFDLQVLDTNNYVCENGFIHHNSGKSRAGTMRILVLMLSNPGANGAYYMPTYDLLNLRALPGIIEDLEMMGIGHKFNAQKMTIQIHGYGNLILRSYDNPKRIVAYEVAFSIVDELDTLPIDKAEEVWRKITERNRQKIDGVKNSIGCVTTPDQGYNGIVYKKWIKEPQEGYEIIKAPTYSNPYLPDDYIDQIRANYDPLLAEMYIEGEIVNLSADKVYHFFDRVKHHSDRELTKDDYEIAVSVDFNVGGCCSTVNVYDKGYPVQVDEFVSNNTYDFIDNLKIRYPDKKITVYPDATGDSDSTNASASDIQLIRSAGFNVDAPKANPLIRNRVNSVNKLLAHEQYRINTNKCPQTTHALETQGYDKQGKPEKFDSHPAIDDWCDSLGYFINRRYPVEKPVLVTGLTRAF